MPSVNEKLSSNRISRLKIVLILTSAYFAVEITGSLLTGSLALIADAGHMLIDIGSLALALFAINYARRPATPQRTFGFYRMEILASLANSVALTLLSIYIFYEGYNHIFHPPEIPTMPMMIIGVVGLAVNVFSVKTLRTHSHDSDGHNREEENLNIKVARLEVLSDMIGSIGVIVTGIIIFTTKFYLADAIFSIGLAIFILPRTWSLLKKSINILMEGVPAGIDYNDVKKAILEVKGVTGLRGLHIWSITSDMNVLSAHVVVTHHSHAQQILREITGILKDKFKIMHSTIQIENNTE